MSIDNYQNKAAHDYPVPDTGAEDENAPANPLDSEEARKELDRLLEWYQQEREKQSINRYQQSIDDDYYDHLQWSDQDAQELRERGQAPLVFNEIKPVIDWIIGTERRTRIDYKILPREDDDVEGALTKTKVFKYVSDVNMEPFEQSDAFAECVRVGVGWIEEGIRKDPEKEPLYVAKESWRNILYDSNGLKADTSDWRYLFRQRWLDLDVSQAAFPDRAEQLRRASISSELYGNEQDEDLWYLGQRLQERDADGNVIGRRTFVSDANYVNNRRERVKLIEGWYRMPVKGRFVNGGSFHGKSLDSNNTDAVNAEVATGEATLYDRLYMQMHVAIFTESDLMLLQRSPYRHNSFPFTPIWGYRRKRDNAPYGAIRGIRDPQDDVNKRGSKALWLLSANQTIADKGAFDDPDEARQELNRPDAFVIKNPGKEVTRDNNRDIAEAHMRMQEQSANRIRQVAGVTGENLGMETNATSGKAIIARQTQGTVVTTELFDNYRRARQISGQKQLSLIEQFYTDEKVVRITGDKGRTDFVRINQPTADGGMLNDITKSQADYIIGEQDYSLSLRVAMFETMLEMVTRMQPEIALKFLDLVFEFSDLPNKSDIVSRLRSISGVVPPDDKMTPDDRKQLAETRAQQAKAAGAQQMLLETQIEQAAATIDKLRAEVAKIKADTAKTSVDTEVAAVGTVGKSMTGAAAIAAEPRIAPIADAMLASGGFTDATPGAGVADGARPVVAAPPPAPVAPPVAPPVAAPVVPVNQPPTGTQP